jgi:hypothetical protein
MPYLFHLAKHGVPAPSSSSPWPFRRKMQAYKRGPHVSARKLYTPFVLEDMYNMVQAGYWCVLPFTAVAHLQHLKLSPAGVVPQRERRPRIILDYSFPHGDNVNASSLPLAPSHAMQFGSTFHRILQRLVYCNRIHGPPLLAKIDLADGYYRVPLSPFAALELAVVLPGDGEHEQLVGIPFSLPMGWTYSPPYFCAYTETATDIANASVVHPSLPPHTLEPRLLVHKLPQDTAFTSLALQPLGPTTLPPLATVDVYLDEFMALAQRPRHTQTMRSLLHSVDAIFYDKPGDTTRRAVISSSKIDKGDASWSTQKTILGWDIDTAAMSITLPPHRQTRLLTILTEVSQRYRVSRRKWQQLLGELRSMALAISGAKYNFSLLQQALVQQRGPRIRLTALIRLALNDWKHLLLQLSHPLPLHSLVPQQPTILAGCDASLHGIGGWLWQPSHPHTVYLWRHPFPSNIQRQVVSSNNPSGSVNNSELELAGIVLSAHLASALSQHPHPTIWCACDNMAAVAWANNGSTSSNAPSAFVLRTLGQLSQERRFTLSAFYLSGATNSIADYLSRCFSTPWHELIPMALPQLPPQTSLEIVHPTSESLWQVTLSLLKQTCPEAYHQETRPGNTPTGESGTHFAPPCDKILSSISVLTPSRSCNSLQDAIAQAKWLPTEVESRLKQWQEPFVPWGRRWPHWDSLTPGSLRRVPRTYGLPDNWQPMAKKTHHLNETNQYRSPSYGRPWSTASWPTHTKAKQ